MAYNERVIRKFPRTPHLEGSRLQPGDADLAQVRFADIAGRRLVVEEKLDGANAAVSFGADGGPLLQSRGHYLTGGPREKQFGLFKAWTATVRGQLWAALGTRYTLYGEWMYAKHTVFYDALPAYFCEFDVLDRDTDTFLSTERRRELLAGVPVASVPVLGVDAFRRLADLTAMVGPSTCRTARWRDALADAADGPDRDRILAETDRSDDMEGLYLKVERDGVVEQRLKWVRASFHTAILDSGTHWQDRPILPNRLRDPHAAF